MAKQLNVSLAFSADTSKVKAQLQDLQRQLANLTNSTGSIANAKQMGITKQLQDASNAAAQLQIQLQNATNVNTGKLDLVKFNQSLKDSKMNLQQYKVQLEALGPAGAQAFSSLAAAVTNAEAPMFRVSTRVRELGTVLKNTVRWQLSSSMLHGFMGAIQGAYGYAKDLNESLNNIRIVTGQSTDQMAKFAKEANKAAKTLSATTTDYTDASLIFYQQGLSDEQVKERAEVTLKMANVSRQSAETVSEQMTSVWNNFDNGSKKLEYYADVMAKLGATTASSSDEIATGLEKFSAVANTVGLSYEYAASALATVTAQTRQSADTVGTAFRTLFTRLEGLKLGETADDGTTLNKYSQALMAVGVNIKDQQDQLKSMDTILDELGAKWQTIGKEQQVALAQTVGGARQYATLIALMDNWDSFQENLLTAEGSSGFLQKQQDIYAESWEAAGERVRASLERIYNELLNDKFFIGLTNGFSGFLEILGNIMDGLGGLKGVLITIGTILVSVYQNQLANGLKSLTTTIYSWTSTGREELKKLRDSASETLKSMTGQNLGNMYEQQSQVLEKYRENLKYMNEEEQRRAQILMEQHSTLAQQVVKTAELINTQEKSVNWLSRTVNPQANNAAMFAQQATGLNTLLQTSFGFSDADLAQGSEGLKQFELQVKSLIETAGPKLEQAIGSNATIIFRQLYASIKDGSLTAEEAKDEIKKLVDNYDTLTERALRTGDAEGKEKEKIEALIKAREALGKALAQNIVSQMNLKNQTEGTLAALEFSSTKIKLWQDNAVSFARTLGSVAMAFTSLNSLKNTWNDDNVSFGDKLLRTMQTLAFVLPAVIRLIDAETIALGKLAIAEGISTAVLLLKLKSKNKEIANKAEDILLTKFKNNLTKKEIALILAEVAATKGLTEAEKEQLLLDKLLLKNKEKFSSVLTMGKWLVIIAAVALAIKGLINLYQEAKKKSPEGVFNSATEALEKSNEAVKDASAAYDELISKFDNLDNGIEKLKELTKGTVEYKNALMSLNSDALKVISEYGLSEEAGDFSVVDGAITISQQGRVKALAQSSKETQNLITGQRANTILTNTSEINALKAKAVGTDVAGADTTHVAIAKELFNNFGGSATEENVKQAVNNLVEQGVLTDYGNGYLENLTNVISKNEYFKEYLEAIKNNTAAIEATMETGISESLSNSVKFNNKDIYEQQVLQDIMAADQASEYEKELSQITNESLTAEDYAAYALANGYESDGKKLYTLDENGKRQEVDDLDVIEGIKALKAFTISSKTVLDKFYADGYEEELASKVSSLSQEEKDKIYKANEEVVASSYGLDYEGFKAYQKDLTKLFPELNDLIEENSEVAIEATRAALEWAEDGGKLLEVLEDNKDALSDKSDLVNYRKALTETAGAVSNLLNVSVSSDFVEEHMSLIKEALNGSESAIIKLKALAAESEAIKLAGEENADLASNLTNNIMSVLENTEVGEIDLLSPTTEKLYNDLQTLATLMGLGAEEAATKFKDMFNLDLTDNLHYKEVEYDSASITTIDGVSTVKDEEGNILTGVTDEMLAEFKNAGKIMMPVFGKSGDFTKAPPKSSFSGFANVTPNSTNKGSKKKDKKKASDEIERYHVVKEQLEDIEQELDRISKAKERAFGGDKLKLMDDEIAKTQELLDKEQEYFDQINANYGPDRKALEAYGAKFDANGALLNYDSLMNAQINAFNSSLSDEAEEKYNNFKELIDKYEETDDLLAEQRQKLIDLQNELFDLMLEKLEYEVTLKIDVNEDANKYLDFLMEMNGDGMDHALDNIDALGEKIANGMEDIETYTNGLNNMFKNRGYKGNVVEDLQSGKVTPEELAEMYDLTEAEVDLLREYMGNIMDTTKEIQNMRKEITDQLIDAMEEINEKFDEQIDKINRAAEGMQHYRDIIDLVGQDVLGISDEMMKTFGEKQLDNSITNVKASRTKMLENEREYNEAVAELERLKSSGASEFAIEEQERVVKAAKENWDSSTSDYYDAWEDAQERVKVLFDDTIKSITDNFEKAMSGIYGNLEALQDAYDRQSEINERYLEDYEKIYELSKLNRDIGNSIDSTDNIRAKQELMKLQEEINALEESGAEISKYDLDFLRQKYELRLAEIALEEAQNAKSQVRMTRDSEGNWNYTYTANEENISKAEQNYEDALYKTQQLTTDYIKDLENRIFQLNTDLVNALSNVDPNDAEGRQRIYDYYMGQNNYLTSQLNNALGNNADIYNQDWMNYSNATGYKISDNEKWMDSFNETTLSMLTGYSSLGDYQNAFRDSSLLMYNSINDAASEFAANTEIVMNAAGTSIETFAEDAEEAFKNFTISTKEATDNIDGIDKEAKETFDAILEKLVEFNEAYDKQIQQTIQANKDLIKSFNDLIAKEAEAKKSSGGSSNNGSPSDTPTTPEDIDSNLGGKSVPYVTKDWYHAGVATRNGAKVKVYKREWSDGRVDEKTELISYVSTSGHATITGVRVGQAVTMDTGGYTGAWGTTAGKLAMLHEKELVLNKQDTENILQSVNLVRQISDWISGRVNAMQYGSMLSAFGLPVDNKNVLEQVVTIHAEFPNANNRAEIEAAFDNLVNRAAQYAYRK